MHWAYHIKDDRYQYLESRDYDGDDDAGEDLEDDDYDTNDYLLSVRDAMAHASIRVDGRQPIAFAGDESLPALTSTSMLGLRTLSTLSSRLSLEHNNSTSTHSSTIKIPSGFGRVGAGSDGRVVVKWLHPDHEEKFVNLSAVMNRGAFSVPDYFPLSKAYTLFTTLGLRWIVVTGSQDGGKVVGILTRYNLLPAHIEMCANSKLENKSE